MTDELELCKGEIARLTEDVQNLEREHKKHLRREQHLSHLLDEALGNTAAMQHGERVLAHYNAHFGRRLRWIPDGTNARMIARAIRCYDTPEEGVVACFESIDGLACRPYLVRRSGFTERCSQGTERQRRDDLKYAMGGDIREHLDESAIERFRGYAREAREAGDGIPKWGPMVPQFYLDQAVDNIVSLRRATQLLRDFIEMQNSYLRLLEREAGVRVQDLLEVAA